MDAKYLQEIKQREQDATPGPWFAETYYPKHISESAVPRFRRVKNDDTVIIRDLSFFFERSDAAFIAHARADIPALIAEVERLNAELAYEKGANKTIPTMNGLVKRSVDKIKTLRADNAAKDQQITTLKKALELACDGIDYSCGGSPIEQYDIYIQQVQEQEGKK